MSLHDNKAFIMRYVEEVLGGDLDLLNEYISEDYVDHCGWKNREGLRQSLKGFQAAFSELDCSVEEMIADEDKVAVHFHMVGTGGRVQKTVVATVIFRLSDGKIVEHWGNSDSYF